MTFDAPRADCRTALQAFGTPSSLPAVNRHDLGGITQPLPSKMGGWRKRMCDTEDGQNFGAGKVVLSGKLPAFIRTIRSSPFSVSVKYLSRCFACVPNTVCQFLILHICWLDPTLSVYFIYIYIFIYILVFIYIYIYIYTYHMKYPRLYQSLGVKSSILMLVSLTKSFMLATAMWPFFCDPLFAAL